MEQHQRLEENGIPYPQGYGFEITGTERKYRYGHMELTITVSNGERGFPSFSVKLDDGNMKKLKSFFKKMNDDKFTSFIIGKVVVLHECENDDLKIVDIKK